MPVFAFRGGLCDVRATGEPMFVWRIFLCLAKPLKALRMPLVILAQDSVCSCAKFPAFLRKESGGGREGGKGFTFLCQNDTCAVFSVPCHVVVTPSAFFLVSA